MKIIPQGTEIFCPHCGTMVYKFDKEVHEGVGGIEHAVPCGGQRALEMWSTYRQQCYNCKESFNSKELFDAKLVLP